MDAFRRNLPLLNVSSLSSRNCFDKLLIMRLLRRNVWFLCGCWVYIPVISHCAKIIIKSRDF